jgi:hypothetical protein
VRGYVLGGVFDTHLPIFELEGNHVLRMGYYKKRGLWHIKIRLGSGVFDVDLTTYSGC